MYLSNVKQTNVLFPLINWPTSAFIRERDWQKCSPKAVKSPDFTVLDLISRQVMSTGHSQLTGSGYFRSLLLFKTKGNQDPVSGTDLLLFRSYNSVVTVACFVKQQFIWFSLPPPKLKY